MTTSSTAGPGLTASGQAPLGEIVVSHLMKSDVRLAGYVADHLLASVAVALEARPEARLLTVTREDEGLAILAGSYLGGQRGVMLMQSSGFGLCANALASFLIPYQIPVPMIVGLRGGVGEFNVAQMAGGQAVPDICRALGVPYMAPVSLEHLDRTLGGLLDTSFATGQCVCIGIGRDLT
jgi:sulfopyruvate decarboxylase TPP-binding subunit